MSEEEKSGSSPDIYFDIEDAYKEAKTEFQLGSTSDKALATGKLIGKSALNVGIWTGKVGWVVVKNIPNTLEYAGNIMKESNARKKSSEEN